MGVLQKPLTQRLHESMGGNSPSGFGSVAMPGVPLPEIEIVQEPSSVPKISIAPSGVLQPPPSLTDAVGRLAQLKTKDTARKQRITELIASLSPLLQEADELVEQCKAERVAFLDSEHDRVVGQGRELLDRIENVLIPSDARALQEWNRARESKGQRLADVNQAKESLKHLSQWSTKREIASAQNAFETAKAKMRAAIEAETAALNEYNTAESELASARATLAEFGKVEQQIQLEMAGQPYRDPILGLNTTPRA